MLPAGEKKWKSMGILAFGTYHSLTDAIKEEAMMKGKSTTDVTLDIDEIALSITSQLNHHHSLHQRYPCRHKLPLIYRVPKHIRHVDPVAYEPIFVSIGPYHNSAPNVLSMEREKWKCLKFVLNHNHHKELHEYILAIVGLEEEIRFCYQDDINVESNKFVQMLLLDACFLLHSLYATNEIVEMPVSKDLQFHKGIGVLNIESEKSDIEMSLKFEISADQVKQVNADASQCQSIQTDTFDDLMQGRPQGNLDPIGMTYTSCITRDIFLLENQIPFFVLKRVYEILAYKKLVSTPLTETIAKHIEGILRKYTTAIGESDRPKDFQHLLHLCHLYFKPSQSIAQHHEYQVQSHYFYRLLGKFVRYFNYSNKCEDVSSMGNHMKCWRRAVRYHEAGVQFKKREQDAPQSLLDMVFYEGMLEIPRLIVDDKTCSLLRNFIAFEQACPKFGNDITAYVAFMSQLISTPDDVVLLSRRGIVVHHMRSDTDVSNFLVKLGKNIDFDMSSSHYLQPLHEKLERHYQNRINRWMAWLWQNHFSNPWLTLAVLAAAIVLICTVLQTLFSFLAYVNPVP